MKLEDRIDLALNIAEGFQGKVDGKQLADLFMHLWEIQKEVKNLPLERVSKPLELITLEVDENVKRLIETKDILNEKDQNLFKIPIWHFGKK